MRRYSLRCKRRYAALSLCKRPLAINQSRLNPSSTGKAITKPAIVAIAAGRIGHRTTVIMPIIMPAMIRRWTLSGSSYTGLSALLHKHRARASGKSGSVPACCPRKQLPATIWQKEQSFEVSSVCSFGLMPSRARIEYQDQAHPVEPAYGNPERLTVNTGASRFSLARSAADGPVAECYRRRTLPAYAT